MPFHQRSEGQPPGSAAGRPAADASARWTSWAVWAGLGGSALALLLAPGLMPDDYSWWAHTTSESAAQGVPGAWLARLGFVLFGVAVLLLAVSARRAWGVAGAALHGTFGVAMLATAAFSARSWVPDAAFRPTEDLVHSVAATVVGFAFALGVVAVLLHNRRGRRRRWALDLTAVVASIVIPLGMVAVPGAAGALQRLMFMVAYAWYAVEAIGRQRPHP
jgi:hypothetical protein